MSGLRVAVVGATGVAGSEIVRVLEERAFPISELVPFASPRSEGRPIRFAGKDHPCRVLSEGCFTGIDLVLMETPASLAKEWVPSALAAGAIVIDNSSAYRYDPDVPLLVPEINAELLDASPRLIASPNCTTLAMVPVLKSLDDAARLTHVHAVSFQAVSGTGQAALADLESETRDYLSRTGDLHHSSRTPQAFPAGTSYPKPIGFNVIPQADDFTGDEGLTKEEWKLIAETRKILGRPELAISPFCTRVPVWVGHSLAVTIETERPLTPAEAEAALAKAPGVRLWPGREYPTPLDVAGTDGTHVGRIRTDPGRPGALVMWICGDNLRKGAGLNNVQIAEELLTRSLAFGAYANTSTLRPTE